MAEVFAVRLQAVVARARFCCGAYHDIASGWAVALTRSKFKHSMHHPPMHAGCPCCACYQEIHDLSVAFLN